MEKELKIAELSALWGVSVPTTWNRIRKEGLQTFIKKNENNKEVNYVRVSDDVINQYVINDNNNVSNTVNNGYYEDMLINNNGNNIVKNPQTQANKDYSREDLQELITTITSVNESYNNRIETLTNRLINAESKQLLLEDKANREGMYINEINGLKKENNRYKLYNNLLITVIITLIIVITGYITFSIGSTIRDESTKKEQMQNAPAPMEKK
jgi:hypothetical protein